MLVIIIAILIILAICSIKNIAFSIVTLGFLPNGLNMFDGKMSSYTIPKIGPIIEPIINYFIVLFLNVIDFIVWFFHWIPGLRNIIDVIYTSPDMAETYFENIFGGKGGHRNFITHSVLNPIFLTAILICVILVLTIGKMKKEISNVIKWIMCLILLLFGCHLLADTMPKSWLGFANIKIYLFSNICTLPPILSKIWLYINSYICIHISFKIAGKLDD